VMAALRRECIAHYATPPALARWLGRPASLPWLLLAAVALLVLAAVAWAASGATAAELQLAGPRLVLPFWTKLPQWLLGSLFGWLVLVDGMLLVRGARRFWRDMAASAPTAKPVTSLGASFRAALHRMVWHDDFGRCATTRVRRAHHLLVVYGMLALWLTSLWVVTARWNPLLDGLVYPLGFWNPWKLLANLAGLAVATGATLMLIERWRRPQTAGATRYVDFALLGFLVAIVASGFLTEALHLWRIDSLRYAAYVVHLTMVLGLLGLLPYSKLAHVVYRTLALVHAERTGRGPR
jgi:quinone-modifying oxidoreductase, subunit QmoC